MKKILATFIMLLLPFAVVAEVVSRDTTSEQNFKFDRYYESHKINADGSSKKSIYYAVTMLKDNALKFNRTQKISYSTSIESAEIVEAYTKKADGKRLDVPKSNYQMEVNDGKDGAKAAFSDRTSLTIIFPDVTVGDTIHLSYIITQKEPMFPNHFYSLGLFKKNILWDDVRIKFDYPVSMKARYDAPMMTEVNNIEDNGRKIVEWSFQNKKTEKDERTSYTVHEFGMDPSYLISTFSSYREVAEEYGKRAKEKAVVNESIQKLADEITKGKTDERELIKLLYEWVSSNISYVENKIGVGSVVPRDLEFVISNRMGDCKDHATLLQTLLAAKKINSTQALVNTNNVYKLYEIPAIYAINHVINYIPSVDMYLDATAKNIPFGMLPSGEYGKPALLIDNYKDGITIPVLPHEKNKSAINIKIKIDDSGKATGTSEIYWKGHEAVRANYILKSLINNKEAEFIQKLLKKFGFEGTGKITKHDKSLAADEAKIQSSFEIKDMVSFGTAGAINIPSVYIHRVINSYKSSNETRYSNSCVGGSVREEFIYEFPDSVDILSVPDNLSSKNEVGIYNATYSKVGNTLHAVREYNEPIDLVVCDHNVRKLYRELADKVMPNLKSQIVYKKQ